LVGVPAIFIVFELAIDNMIMAQLLTFIFVSMTFRWQPIRMKLVPKNIKQRSTSRHAHEQYFLQNIHHTEQRNGIMLFVSEAEHYV